MSKVKNHDLDALKAKIKEFAPNATEDEINKMADDLMAAATSGGDSPPEDKPKENPEETEAYIAVDENGKCPEGYHPDAEGKACIKDDAAPPAGADPPAENKAKHSNTQKPITNTTRQLKHAFKWAVPLAVDNPKELMLIKGVAMSEGTAKRGEVMTAENVIFGAGAMSTAAMFGVAPIDIDHFEDKLPDEYVKEFGAAINDPYPVGFIIDAHAEQNDVEGEGKIYQVEYIAAITNPLVYKMIEEGKFVGNSVVDWYRKENCSACGGKEGCNCSIEGSHFLVNTLVLKGTPNSNATWVAPITEADIGTIIVKPTDAEMHDLHAKKLSNSALQAKYNFLLVAKHNKGKHKLSEYVDETGKFTEGQVGIKNFLVKEKSIDETKATELAEFLFIHPTALAQDQFEFMSGSDLIAWFEHIEKKNMQAAFKLVAKNLAQLNLVPANYKLLKVLNADQLGKGEVNYKAAEPNSPQSCGSCRWFSGMIGMDGSQGTDGYCAIVSGDIRSVDVCDRHETIQAKPASGEPAAEPSAENNIDDKVTKLKMKLNSIRPDERLAIDKHAETPRTGADRFIRPEIQSQINAVKKRVIFFGKRGANEQARRDHELLELKKKLNSTDNSVNA